MSLIERVNRCVCKKSHLSTDLLQASFRVTGFFFSPVNVQTFQRNKSATIPFQSVLFFSVSYAHTYTLTQYNEKNEFCLLPWEEERKMGRHWTTGLLIKQETETGWGLR